LPTKIKIPYFWLVFFAAGNKKTTENRLVLVAFIGHSK
jgi:hypothetical protein